MSYNEQISTAREIASRSMSKMESLDIAPYPDNFEIWYAFHAGIDAELSRKLTNLLENIDLFDAAAFQSIKKSYLGEDTSRLLMNTSDSVDATISSALASISEASIKVWVPFCRMISALPSSTRYFSLATRVEPSLR